MAHRYGLPIRVETDQDGEPRHFIWRGVTYSVEEVLNTWHLKDRWWVSPVAYAHGDEPMPPSDRLYYRVQAPGFQIFDLYYDRAINTWVLDGILD